MKNSDRKAAISQLELKAELDRRIAENGMRWYIPNGAQEEFINVIGNGDMYVGVASFANGVGKTALMVNVLAGFIFGKNENKYFDKPLFNRFPYIHRGRIISTTKNVEEIGAIQTEIKKWFPVGKYETNKGGKRFDSEYYVGDWVIDIMTYDQDVDQFESATLGILIFDEPPPIRILNASIARMRKGGIILIFMTPLDTGGEIIEDLTEKGAIEIDGNIVGKVYVQYAEIESNCKEHGIRGHLEHNDIVKMLNFYDPEEKEARAKGKPSHIVGRIYPDFDNAFPYVVDDFEIPEDWYRVNILDPHDGIPYALSWVAIDATGDLYVYAEFPFDDLEKCTMTNLTIPDYSRIIREKEGRSLTKLRIIDPFFGNKRYSNTGKTVKEELGDFGLDYEDGDTSGVDTGHKRLREFMKYQKAFPVGATNHPKLHVFKSCRNHWRSLLRYRKKVQKSGEVKDKIIIDETYKHFCDNLRHLVMRRDINILKNVVQESGKPSYRIVGDMGDIHFDDDDEDNHSPAYRQLIKARQ